MAITLLDSGYTLTNGTNPYSNSFAPTGDKVVFAVWAGSYVQTAENSYMHGFGATWNLIGEYTNQSGTYPKIASFWAVMPSSPGTGQVDWHCIDEFSNCGWIIFEASDADGSDASGAQNGSTWTQQNPHSVTLPTFDDGTNSWTIAAAFHYGTTSGLTMSPDADFTELQEVTWAEGINYAGLQVQYRQVPDTTCSVGFSSTPNNNFIVGWEMKRSVGPAVPTNLAAVAVSPTQINLSWDDAAGATGYDIEEDTEIIESNYQGTHTPGSPYQRTGRAPSTEYDYRVRSVKET